MYEGFPHLLIDGQTGELSPSPITRPIFTQQNDKVSCVHYRPFIEQAATMLGQPLSTEQVAALNLFDQCANRADLALHFILQPGDCMILHNRTVLHARTDYEDWPQPEKRRHLLRVWIDAPGLLPVSPEHELGDIFN